MKKRYKRKKESVREEDRTEIEEENKHKKILGNQ